MEIGQSWHQCCVLLADWSRRPRESQEAGIQFGSWEAGAPLWVRGACDSVHQDSGSSLQCSDTILKMSPCFPQGEMFLRCIV